MFLFIPYVTNELASHYHLGEPTFTFGALGVNLNFHFIIR